MNLLLAFPRPTPEAPTPSNDLLTEGGGTLVTESGDRIIKESGTGAELWSDPATHGGSVPSDGSDVTIPAGKSILLDQDITLGALIIDGDLTVARESISITAEYILVRSTGVFTAGTEAEPFASLLNITLTGTNKTAVPATSGFSAMGGRLLGARGGGRIELIAEVPDVTWTQLNGSLVAGANHAFLTESPGWKIGDRIVFASTDYDMNQTEERVISAISGNMIVWEDGLSYYHHGAIETVTHTVTGAPTQIDMRGEVCLLTHRIKIQGASDSTTLGYGGHVMINDQPSIGRFQGVELYRMGQGGILGRYPFHFHDLDETGSDSWVKKCSIHTCYNRGLAIHKTQGLFAEDVVSFGTFGHNFFFEDGKESGNWLNHCIGGLTSNSRDNPTGIDLDFMPLESNEVSNVSVFWIVNPNNRITNCCAAGCATRGNGFWYELGSNPKVGSITFLADPTYNPSAQPMGEFSGNRAHSIDGADGNVETHGYGCWIQPGGGPGCNVIVNDFVSYSCGIGGVWTGGIEPLVVLNQLAIVAGRHCVLNRTNTTVNDSLFVRTSSNPNNEAIFAGFGITRSAVHIYEGHSGTTVNSTFFKDFNTFSSNPAQRAVMFSSNPKINIGKDSLGAGCKQSNCEIGYWNHEGDIIQTLVQDTYDLFGNGHAGSFVHSPGGCVWLKDSNSKNAESDAIGIPAATKVRNTLYGGGKLQDMFWVPREFAQISLSATTTGILIKRGDGPELSTVENNITTNIMLGPVYEVSDSNGSSLEGGGNIDLNLAKVTDQVTFKIKWDFTSVAARAITDLSQYPTEQVVPIAASLSAFNAGTAVAAFIDLAAAYLYLRLPVTAGAGAKIRWTP